MSRGREVSVLATGCANLASVRACFERLECRVRFVETAASVRDAEFLVLPGVGSFAAGMQKLSDVASALRERCDEGRPLLAICLGMQLLCEGSDEAPGIPGLGVVPRRITRLPQRGLPRPQLGWNRVEVSTVISRPLRA